MRFAIAWIICTAVIGPLFAQNQWAAGGMYLPGFLYAHTDDAKNLEAHVKGFEISVARINNADKYWNRFYKNAQVGYNFTYFDLGKPHITGKSFGLGASFQFRIAGTGKNYLSWRLGTGLGYLTEKFDINKNRNNMAIGSNVNGCIQMSLIYNTAINHKINLKTGLGFTHYSNGAMRVPNLGVNMPSLFVGMDVGYGKPVAKLADTVKSYKTTASKNELLLNYAFKEKFTAKPKQFSIISAGYRRNKVISAVRRWYWGADLVWDPTHPYSYFLNEDNPRVAIDNSTELGLVIGHRYDIGRFAMLTDIGFYLLNPYQIKYFSYQRIGFRYELSEQLFLNGTLKVHFGTADYFEWGLGYKFGSKKNKHEN